MRMPSKSCDQDLITPHSRWEQHLILEKSNLEVKVNSGGRKYSNERRDLSAQWASAIMWEGIPMEIGGCSTESKSISRFMINRLTPNSVE
jgi:hypothetical protein